MKKILIMTVAFFMLTAAMISRAGEQNVNGFVGLWEAVDPNDGSHQILSITNNGDGTVKLLGYDTYWTLCNGGRGVEQGAGEVVTQQLLKVDDFLLTCFDTGETLSGPSTFTRNSDGTLTERDLANPSMLPIIFHRTSN